VQELSRDYCTWQISCLPSFLWVNYIILSFLRFWIFILHATIQKVFKNYLSSAQKHQRHWSCSSVVSSITLKIPAWIRWWAASLEPRSSTGWLCSLLGRPRRLWWIVLKRRSEEYALLFWQFTASLCFNVRTFSFLGYFLLWRISNASSVQFLVARLVGFQAKSWRLPLCNCRFYQTTKTWSTINLLLLHSICSLENVCCHYSYIIFYF